MCQNNNNLRYEGKPLHWGEKKLRFFFNIVTGHIFEDLAEILFLESWLDNNNILNFINSLKKTFISA